MNRSDGRCRLGERYCYQLLPVATHGAAWWQHVYQVQVYAESDGGFPYMVYHVKDAPKEAQKRSDRGKEMMIGKKLKARLQIGTML